MNREGRDCAYPPCGKPNPKTSHWHIGDKRFCCKAHYEAFKEDGDAADNHTTPHPATFAAIQRTGIWGASPRGRR